MSYDLDIKGKINYLSIMGMSLIHEYGNFQLFNICKAKKLFLWRFRHQSPLLLLILLQSTALNLKARPASSSPFWNHSYPQSSPYIWSLHLLELDLTVWAHSEISQFTLIHRQDDLPEKAKREVLGESNWIRQCDRTQLF